MQGGDIQNHTQIFKNKGTYCSKPLGHWSPKLFVSHSLESDLVLQVELLAG